LVDNEPGLFYFKLSLKGINFHYRFSTELFFKLQKNIIMRVKLLLSFVVFVLFQNTTEAQNKIDYKVVKTFHIASTGWWDYISVNENNVYVSHGTQVNILDKNSGDSVGVIPNTTGVHGIAFDNELGRGYTSNGRLNNVTVFDLKTNAIITQIATTGENPDAIMYEPFTKTIITNNGRSKSLSFINPETNTVIHTVQLDGKPEEGASDGKGKLFVNIEDKSEIAVVDLNTFKVIDTWPLAPGEGPSGLAIDTKTNRLFSGCSDSKLLIVMDASNGKIIAKLQIGEGSDGTTFDANKDIIFVPNGRDGTISVFKEKSANDYESLGTITTKAGARTINIDKKTGDLFLPTAEFEPADPKNPQERRKMVPGTFQVLKVGK
jgi:DNA-binding beta-propeller fold protein YncE